MTLLILASIPVFNNIALADVSRSARPPLRLYHQSSPALHSHHGTTLTSLRSSLRSLPPHRLAEAVTSHTPLLHRVFEVGVEM